MISWNPKTTPVSAKIGTLACDPRNKNIRDMDHAMRLFNIALNNLNQLGLSRREVRSMVRSMWDADY